ncbi:hypothetical protein OBBRIDRAFT_839898 [Obba rivulosa]|uniref:DUF6533 domain-containing protein n=1 Tax=Obba rivulosa TaxID=1052685 RepID=A0A8E2AKX8_9APHY|nr:hypothetical protein OBBRIDRAFT_839898 [Obba rivulosa]
MSQVGQVLEQDIIRGLESIRAETYCGVAASALVFYDYASTMSREVQFMWRRPVSIVTVLFLMNRWAMLMWAVAILAGIFTSIATITGYYVSCYLLLAIIDWKVINSCIAISQFTNVVSVVLFALWAVFSTIRVYAISLHNLWLALIVFAVSMAPVGTNVVRECAQWIFL